MSSRCLPRPRSLVVAFVMVLVCVLHPAGSSSAPAAAASAPADPAGPVLIQAAGRGNPSINFRDGLPIPAAFPGTAGLASALTHPATKGLALASADFDEDGMPDLVASYGTPAGGLLSLHFGNVDAVYPNAPEARQRRAKGTFVDAPFLPDAKLFETPERPDFIGAGDFDADGHRDVVAARQGGRALALHRGDGAGGFHPTESLPLPGAVTAMATGDVNRRGGLEDVLVGVVAADGPRLLVFEWIEGALKGDPEVFDLPHAATGFAVGQMDEEFPMDLAVAAGRYLVMITGRDRHSTMTGEADSPEEGTQPRVHELPFELIALAAGDYDADGERELALLASDGALRLSSVTGVGKLVEAPSEPIEHLDLPPSGDVRLMSARISSMPGDHLVFSPRSGRSLVMLTGGSTGTGTSDRPPALSAAFPLSGDSIGAVASMRLNPDAVDDLIVLGEETASLSSLETAPLSIFTVSNTNDSGAGSLRQAILDANAAPGLDTIGFSVAGAGPHTITPASPLPVVTSPATIDATTEPDFAGTPVVELVSRSLVITAGNSTVRGLVVRDVTPGSGIHLITGGNNVVEGNFIGTDHTGTLDRGNEMGIVIVDNNVVGSFSAAGRNVISGNGDGISINGTGNDILGNRVGTNAAGTGPLGNEHVGIVVGGPGNRIGGPDLSSANVVSANDFGIIMATGSTGNLIEVNFIGTDVGGTSALENHWDGIYLQAGADGNMIGVKQGQANVISGNRDHGVNIQAAGTLLQGNLIGVDVTGTAELANGRLGLSWPCGVLVEGGPNNRIGGIASGIGNIISGNFGSGVLLLGRLTGAVNGNLVQNNYIGTNADGSASVPNSVGVNLFENVNDTMIRDNVISGNGPVGNWGLSVYGPGSNISIMGNRIGTNATGTAAIPNYIGVAIASNFSGSIRIGSSAPADRNVVSGNLRDGIRLGGSVLSDIRIQGNLIGTSASGAAALGNLIHGIRLTSVDGILVGGAAPGEGNLISGNGENGIHVEVGQDHVIQGNVIGANMAGTAAIGNTTGILLQDATTTTIRGNVVSGNGSGIEMIGASSTGNTLAGNLIGTDVTGSAALPNGIGVLLEDGSGNRIGGPDVADRNVVSANGNNLVIIAGTVLPSGNVVEGNYFGTDASGTAPLGSGASNVALVSADSTMFRGNVVGGDHTRGLRLFNSDNNAILGNRFGVSPSSSPIGLSGPGILVEGTSNGNTIGGPVPAESNLIANNAGDGIRISGSAVRNAILGNAIHSNGELGIDLDPNGVTPNDGGDLDPGPNDLQNFPTVASVDTTGGSVTVSGALGSQVSSSYRVEFFASPSCDPSGNGEGAAFLGAATVPTDGTGTGGFSATLPSAVAAGEVVTATATDLFGNTSEFSACMAAAGVPPPAPTAVEFLSPVDLTWEEVPGAMAYHLYAGTRGTLSGLATPALDSCKGAVVQSTGGRIPPSDPPPGSLLWLLVTAEGPYGEGPVGPGSNGPRQHDSIGDCGDSCAHSTCEAGGPLNPVCALCAGIVCEEDPACCTSGWTEACVQQMHTVCRSLNCPASQGQCSHPLCEQGAALVPGCDVPPLPSSCTTAICNADPYCCQQSWDDLCIAQVGTVCGYNCL